MQSQPQEPAKLCLATQSRVAQPVREREGNKVKEITLEQVQAIAVCDQPEIFRELFGTSAKITRANIKKAVQAGLGVAFLVYKLTRIFVLEDIRGEKDQEVLALFPKPAVSNDLLLKLNEEAGSLCCPKKLSQRQACYQFLRKW
jgi:hypothetical protein